MEKEKGLSKETQGLRKTAADEDAAKTPASVREYCSGALEKAVEGFSAAVYVKGGDGRYIFFSRWLENGKRELNPEAFIGKTDRDLFGGDIAEIFGQSDRKVISENSTIESEERLIASDGRLRTYATMKFPMPGMQGAVCGITTDITGKRQAEEELRKNDEKLRKTQQMAGIGNWELDVIGNRLHASEELLNMLGRDIEQYLTTVESALTLVHPDDRLAVKGALEGAIANNSPFFADFRVVLPRGEEKTVHVTAETEYAEGRVVRMNGMVQDITGRKKMEDELLKAQKLESIGVLAGGIAHDFNNLLLGILGNISVAKSILSPDDRVYGILNEVEKAAVRTKSLTRQLLTFSKGGEPVREAASVAELVKASAGVVLRGSAVRCSYDLPDGLWPVDVDEGQISQVFNNVILNAVQAMEQEGVLEIKASNEAVTEKDNLPAREGDYVKVSIKDNGAGIPETILGRIFDPFFTTKDKASGLGLALTYSIIKKHSGCILAESEEGDGTTVHIYLPSAGKKEVRTMSTEDALVKGKGRILVMDDEDLIRDVTGEMLGLLGYETEFAVDGHEAIEIFKKALDAKAPFSAAILDLTVPGGMGGKEAVKKFLEIDPGFKAIVSSGYSKDPIMSDFKKYGFCAVIAKPYNVVEFSKIIAGVVAGQKGSA